MTSDPARVLRASAVAFGGVVAITSVVAARDNVEGRPLGVRLPISVRTGIAAGWGAGIAAPWPMAVAAIVVANRTKRTPASPWPGRVCASLGLAGVAGLLVEPNTYRPSSWSRATRLSLVVDLAAKCALFVAATWHLRTSAAPVRCAVAP